MDVPAPRAPVTAQLWKSLITGSDIGGDISGWVEGSSDLADDDDFQLALWMLYEAHYRGFDNGGADDEWRLDHLRLRAVLEGRFEGWLRARTEDFVALVDEPTDDFADLLFGAVADQPNLLGDVIFGAGACLLLDAHAAEFVLGRWEANLSSLVGTGMPDDDVHEQQGA